MPSQLSVNHIICVRLPRDYQSHASLRTIQKTLPVSEAPLLFALPVARVVARMTAKDDKPRISEQDVRDLLNARSNPDPVPTLSHRAENRVLRELRDVALKGCDNQIRAFAECANGRTLSMVWHCRHLNKEIQKCMQEFGQDGALKDELRRRHGLKFPRSVTGYKPASNFVEEETSLP